MEKKKPDGHQHAQAGIHPFRSQFHPTNLIPNCLLFALGVTFGFLASFHISRHLSIFNPSGFSFFFLPLQNAANASAGLNPSRGDGSSLGTSVLVNSSLLPKWNSSQVVPVGVSKNSTQETSSPAVHRQQKSSASISPLPLRSSHSTREKAGTETEGDTEHHTVNHGMEDDALFWRAAMVSKVHSRQSHKRVPKVAFLFLTRGSLPLAPLWERFFKGHDDKYSIYVHTDPSYKVAVPMQSVFYGRRIPSREVRWGHISLVQAERRLLANALLDPSNQRFMILSESCIPLFPFTTIYDYLINSTQSFVDVYDDPRPFGRGRYDSRMAPLIRLEQWRKGLAWFEVDRRIAVEIVSDNTYFPLFDKFPVPVPDEHYFPTLMNIRFGPWGANRSLTYVDWSKGGSHPAGFGRLDVTYDLLWKMRNGNRCVYDGHETSLCTLFARKFFPDSLGTLLDMASQALGF